VDRVSLALRTFVAWIIDYVLVASALGVAGLLTIMPAIGHEAPMLGFLAVTVVLVVPFSLWWRASPERRRTWSIGRRVTRLTPFGRRA
jgi:hypothetical protein